MSKNLCPENNITFENSQTIRFETPIPAGTYTVSSIVESTDTDSANCLLLFYYEDNSTLEVYIGRSSGSERVSKTFVLTQDATKVRIYASEGYNPSVGDTATFTQLMIEAGDQMTDYVPYGEEPAPEEPMSEEVEIILHYMALAGHIGLSYLVDHVPYPTCRETALLRKLLDPSYEVPFLWISADARVERYLVDLINGTTERLSDIPKSDKEKYLHVAIGGTVDEMPNPDACLLNYWMNEWLKKLGKI